MIDCLIPARGGSKGIKNKNIYKINDIPLIAYTIHVAQKCANVRRVFVSTDSEEIAEIAKKFGAIVPFIRPVELASDIAKDIEVFRHFIEEGYRNNLSISENILHLRATAPGRDSKIVDEAIGQFLKVFNEFTSLRSAHLSNDVPFKWYRKEEKCFRPLINKSENNELLNMPRQYFPKTYIPNSYVDIVKSQQIMDENLFHGNSIMAYVTDNIIDIDTFQDLENVINQEYVKNLSYEIKK